MWLCISFPVTGSKFNMLHGLRIKVKSSWLDMDTRHEIFALTYIILEQSDDET